MKINIEDILANVERPVDLTHADFVEITITADRVYVHTERGLAFRAYRVGNVIVDDQREVKG